MTASEDLATPLKLILAAASAVALLGAAGCATYESTTSASIDSLNTAAAQASRTAIEDCIVA